MEFNYFLLKYILVVNCYLKHHFTETENVISFSEINSKTIVGMWNSYKIRNNIHFSSREEDIRRMNVYRGNLEYISQSNTRRSTNFSLKENKFSHMTPEEMKLMLGIKRRFENVASIPSENTTEIDWVKKGAVTSVKDQGNCGSCWSFSAIGSLEGFYFIKHERLLELSEKELVDCSSDFGNNGCKGGEMDFAFQYIIKNGIETYKDYPYDQIESKCTRNRTLEIKVMSGYIDIPAGSEKDLSEKLKEGPISVAIDASSLEFMFYADGVYYNKHCNSTELNHGVLVVGQGVTQEGEEYYLVKNSWGDQWGSNGYVKMSRNRDNNCGIATMASYPIVI